jgi:DNA polymerase-3 subunit delta'
MDPTQLLTLEKIPSTLLFVRGELTEAIDFAKKLLQSQAGSQPDLHLLQPEGKSGNHPFESIQQLVREMPLPPYASSCKVFIIEQAERMLSTSSNALLKSLEEPAEDTYLILLSDHPDLLLPTLLSRCWRIDCAPLKETLTLDPAAFQLLSEEINLAQLTQTFIIIEESLEEEESALRQKKIDQILHALLQWYRDRHLLAVRGDPSHLVFKEHRLVLEGCKAPLPSLEKVFSLISQARVAIQHNVRLRTALETFFLTVSE